MHTGPHPEERAERASRRTHNAQAAALSLIALAALTACTVGPDFVRPDPPAVTAYTSEQTPTTLAAGSDEAAQRLTLGQAIEAAWWELFGSAKLNELISQALAGNQNLAAAEATLARARADVDVTRGGLFPQIDFGADISRRKSGIAKVVNSYSLGLTASYAVDLFGQVSRRVEQQRAVYDVQNYQLAAVYLALTGDVASQVIAIAAIRLQIATTEDIIADDERNLQLVRTMLAEGKAAELDVLTAETQLANDRAQLPSLRQQLSVAQHALSTLTGRFAAEGTPPDIDLAELTLPAGLPVTLPSELVRQRPDILAAEAGVHVANAAIGVATADMYPSISISGSLAQQAATFGTLFGAASTFWSIAGGLAAPIFHGGALEAQRQSALAGFRASAAIYKQTVLEAFQQVADVLDALRHDADLVAAQRTAFDVAGRALALQRQSYAEGKSDVLQLLDSQRQYQQARLGLARAQAQRFQDTIQLFVAMGGGWWNARGLGAQRLVTPVAASSGQR
jgi:NodT family efflux transporter outer membrane factor (OMF) lipoprotein